MRPVTIIYDSVSNVDFRPTQPPNVAHQQMHYTTPPKLARRERFELQYTYSVLVLKSILSEQSLRMTFFEYVLSRRQCDMV